ncbi:unnamed protein product [Merluccius merluccius]
MGKAEPTPHRFRRKVTGQGSSSGASEQSCDSASSSHAPSPLCAPSAVDNLMDSGSSPPDLTPHLPRDPPTNNGLRGAQADLTEVDTDMSTSLVKANGVAVVDPDLHADLHDPEHLRLSSCLPDELSELPRSEITPLCSNASLALSACRVQTDHSSLLVIFIANTSDSAARQFALQVTSEELEVSRVSDEEEEVEGHSVAVCQYSLVPTRPSVHMELAGVASYQLPDGEPQTTRFSYTLSLTNFIRPLTVSTEQYGRLWLAFSNDTKQNLKLLSESPDPLRATLHLLRDKLQLHIVDIIASEGIVACQLLQGQPCLMHCRINAGCLAVWLRSSLPELPDCLLYHCQRALAEH